MSDVKPIFFAVGFIGSLIGAAWLLISLAEGADKSSRSKDALRQTTVAEAENIGLICLQTERYELLATCTRACRNIHSSYEDDTPPEVACT